MEIQFLTLPKYAGQVIDVTPEGVASMGGDQPSRWQLLTDPPNWMTDAVTGIFTSRGDSLEGVYQLDYPDINGLGNSMYRLDGKKDCFCLKMLGKAAGNERETLVWEILGYSEADKQSGATFEPIKGLPPQKLTYVDSQLRTILMPYYEGVLKPISGGSYEFPLVLAVVLYLEETLNRLHQRGLAYMDLCPSNILFKTAPAGFLLFFLADMGGVKPLKGFPDRDPRFQQLVEVVSPRRWTRRESLPPADMFMLDESQPKIEQMGEYDHHTLARTALVLLGLGSEGQVSDALAEGFPEQISLEEPMKPIRAEIERLLGLLEPWLQGEVMGSEKRESHRRLVADLFRDFFRARAHFCGEQLTGTPLHQRWRELLQSRMLRYRTALGLEGHKELQEECEAAMADVGKGSAARELAQLNSLPEALKSKDLEASLNLLRDLASSSLVSISRTANYSWFYHRKLARCIWGARGGINKALEESGGLPVPARPFEDEPESATARALRRGESSGLGTLTRTL
ncbi:MAG: hypothetical protein QNK37_29550 [Acidobacteriota bacterium]|nr:hypothetical protein [Acidobacteriota bacterium]